MRNGFDLTATALLTFAIVMPLAGALLVVADRLTGLSYRKWSPWVAALACAGLGLGAFVAGRAAAGEFAAGRSWGTAAVIATLSGLAAVVASVCVGRTAAAATRGESMGVSVLGCVLATLPLFTVAAPLFVWLAVGVLVSLEISRQRDVFRSRLLTVLAAGAESGQPPLRLVESLLDARFAKFVMRRRLEAMAGHLQSGLSVTEAVAASGLLRNDQVLSLRAASASGVLPEELSRQAAVARENARGNVANRVVNSAAYLYAISVVLMSVVSFVFVWIVPKLREIFLDFGVPLPEATERMLRMEYLSPAVFTAAILLLCLLCGAYLIRFPASSLPPRLLSFLPRRLVSPEVLRALAVAVDARSPVETVVIEMQRSSTTEYWREIWADIGGGLSKGDSLSRSLRDAQLLGGSEAAAADAAHRRGTGQFLRDVAGRIHDRHALGAAALTRGAGFLLFAVLAGLCGVVVVGLMSPIAHLIEELS